MPSSFCDGIRSSRSPASGRRQSPAFCKLPTLTSDVPSAEIVALRYSMTPVVIGRGGPSGRGWNHKSEPNSAVVFRFVAPVNTRPDPSGIQDANDALAKAVDSRWTAPVATSTVNRCAVPVSVLRTAAASRSPAGDHAGATKKPGASISGGLTAITVRMPEPSAATVTSALWPGAG